MIDDLSEALAIETVRTGHTTGEATTVLRTLPRSARRRLPLRMRDPRRLTPDARRPRGDRPGRRRSCCSGHTHRGIGAPANVSPPAALTAVPLAQNAAHDYNPFGTPEHVNQVQFAVDGDPNTFWSTFTYTDPGQLGKPGTGIYVDAAPGVAARAIVLQTQTPGFVAQIWASDNADLPGDAAGGHRRRITDRARLAAGRAARPVVAGEQPIRLDHRRPSLPVLPRLDHAARRRPAERRPQRGHALPVHGAALRRVGPARRRRHGSSATGASATGATATGATGPSGLGAPRAARAARAARVASRPSPRSGRPARGGDDRSPGGRARRRARRRGCPLASQSFA